MSAHLLSDKPVYQRDGVQHPRRTMRRGQRFTCYRQPLHSLTVYRLSEKNLCPTNATALLKIRNISYSLGLPPAAEAGHGSAGKGFVNQRKQWIVAIVAVDVLFVIAAAWWFIGRVHPAAKPSTPPPSADVRVTVRRVRPKLMEIDLINNGNAPGPMNRSISVNWTDADLVDCQALPGFDKKETSRRSVQFHPAESGEQSTLAPGAIYEVGWVQLTEDSPVQADFAAH